MHSVTRCFAVAALSASVFTAVFAVPAMAQPAKQQAQAARQMVLTQKHIDALFSAQKDLDAFTAKTSPSSSIAQTNATVVAQLDAVVKKHGLASYGEYNIVLDNIGLVMAGMDPKAKIYVGPAAAIKQKIAAVQADKTMSAEDKKEKLADLHAVAKAPPPPVEHKGNIDLVIKHYDKLAAMIPDE